MPDFLLEIGCEEIPARMIHVQIEVLAHSVGKLLLDSNLGFGPEPDAIEAFSTPRRLSVIVRGLAASQPDTQERVLGPSCKVAFREGVPTPAAESFATRVGIELTKLDRVSTPKGEYLSANVSRKGRNASEILAEGIPKKIEALNWPKNMYWRAGKPERFVRPIRWMVAMLDGQVVPLEFGGIMAGNQSRGHRILGPETLSIISPTQYVESLRNGHVMASSAEREHRIRKALDAVTRALPGARWREDAALLSTVVNLTEWPSAILGSFDKQYLSLPEEVLVTVMRDHQKYFAVEGASGKLAPHFLAVLNTEGDPGGLIRHGNERVLRARFNDARFFWDTDQKTPLENRREMLKAVTFQKDLGSYHEKAERTYELAERMVGWVTGGGLSLDQPAVLEAARLAKTDLTTELVKEFTELQGIIGGLYARAQGLPQRVADAIYDHYKPASMEDSVPRTLEGAVLSIADKADSIAGMFALGLVPSGSKDPFALRRQANGIVKTIDKHKLPLYLTDLMAQARAKYNRSEAEKKFTLSGDAYLQAVRGFFRERLEFYLRDACGLAYDVVNATLAADANDVVDAVARAEAIKEVRSSADFESISTAFKRMKNILRQAEEAKKRIAVPYSPAALQEEAERHLGKAIPPVAAAVNKLRASRQYDEALIEISKLRPAIDAFFDKVMVMVDDESLRANRLGLLQTLVDEFTSIADFSEIVAESK